MATFFHLSIIPQSARQAKSEVPSRPPVQGILHWRTRWKASVPVAQLAAHRNAWSAWHALHGCHTGHTLHGTREVGSAVRTESPAQFEQALALGTGTLELLTTGGANLEIRLYAGMTIVAGLALGHLCQQRFFLQLAFINLCQCLPGT